MARLRGRRDDLHVHRLLRAGRRGAIGDTSGARFRRATASCDRAGDRTCAECCTARSTRHSSRRPSRRSSSSCMNLAFSVPLAAVLAIVSFIIGFFPIVGSWSVYLPVAAWLVDLPRRAGAGAGDGADRILREHRLHLDVPAPEDRRRAVEGPQLLLDAGRARSPGCTRSGWSASSSARCSSVCSRRSSTRSRRSRRGTGRSSSGDAGRVNALRRSAMIRFDKVTRATRAPALQLARRHAFVRKG